MQYVWNKTELKLKILSIHHGSRFFVNKTILLKYRWITDINWFRSNLAFERIILLHVAQESLLYSIFKNFSHHWVHKITQLSTINFMRNCLQRISFRLTSINICQFWGLFCFILRWIVSAWNSWKYTGSR